MGKKFFLLSLICLSLHTLARRKAPGLHEPVNHSFANHNAVKLQHLDWQAKLNFKSKQIQAKATWSITHNNAKSLILDQSALIIDSVQCNGRKVNHELKAYNELLGGSLHIPLKADDTTVAIYYKTTKDGRALQWLEPAQTAGKKMPFVYTQCQAIMARSIIPCADIPSVRFTYTAQVTAPKGMLVLMSAENPKQKNASGSYRFKMDKPIPAYLFALAAGNIEYKSYNAQCGVYAEPITMPKAHKELVDMPQMIKAAEQIAGPYSWGRYDVIILPPSFPFGGMENPKLTFATPTILAGDKSLTNLIAHELAHSWSGNTVTNATWDELWLNEGFTTYFEKRISEAVYGKDYVDMLWELSYQDLLMDLESYGEGHPYTSLKIDLQNEDPDESFSGIPYDKGSYFLRLCELTVGREKFDRFMLSYFRDNAFKPMTTELLLEYMNEHLWKENPKWIDQIGVQEWVYGKTLPKNLPRPPRTKFDAVDQVIKLIDPEYNNVALLKKYYTGWSTNERLYFLRAIEKDLTAVKMSKLDKVLNLTKSGNSELAFQWYLMSIRKKYQPAMSDVEKFLLNIGRTKFVRPLYQAMLEGDTEMQARARRIFAKATIYHPATRKRVEELFDN